MVPLIASTYLSIEAQIILLHKDPAHKAICGNIHH